MSCEFLERFRIREEGALNLVFNIETYVKWALIWRLLKIMKVKILDV